MLTSEEVKEAMQRGYEVEYGGIKYLHINAYIYRIVREWDGTRRAILQVELQDRCKNATVVASAKDIKIIK